MPVEITSRQNPIVRACRELARERDGDRVLLDGAHLIEDALEPGITIESVIASDTFAASHARLLSDLETKTRGTLVYIANEDVLQAASPVKTPGGIVGIATLKLADLSDVLPQHASEGSPYLAAMAVALVDVQDPGNAGAVIRCVEAAGGTGVVSCGTTSDLRGSKSLRASMGSAFPVPITAAPIDQLFSDAKVAGVRVIAST